jgi:signal peptidase I
MDIDLPLILFIAVALTGVGWVLDWWLNGAKRKRAIANVEAQFAKLDAQQKTQDEAYLTASAAAKTQPLWAEYSQSFFPVLALVFVLRSFLLEPFQIPSGSMIPTLEIGDYIAVNKFAYGIRLPIVKTKVISIGEPKRGDVVVFFPPHDKRYFIKRLIGMPGDTIRYSNNQLYVNGEEIKQEFLESRVPAYAAPGEVASTCFQYKSQYSVVTELLGDTPHIMQKCNRPGQLSIEGTYVVPAGHYFMMGDNRDNSLDSRAWGMVPDKNIVGKAFAVWLHWPHITDLPSFSRVGVIK